VLESGNLNMEYSLEVETPLEESNTNWERTLRCGHPLLLISCTELFLSLNAKQFLTLIPYLSVTELPCYYIINIMLPT